MTQGRDSSPSILQKTSRLTDSPNNTPYKSHSVTVINQEDLPAYSCERFYLLSELQLRAHSAYLLEHAHQEDNATEGTTSTVADDESVEHDETIASMALFYLFWKPTMTSSASEFIDDYIVPRMNQLQSLRNIVSSLPTDAKRTISGSLSSAALSLKEEKAAAGEGEEQPKADITVDQQMASSEKGSDGRPNISVYLVVERLALVDEKVVEDTSDPLEATRKIEKYLQGQEKLIKELAGKVSRHPELRELCEGITVGLSNHERAAPALEACVDTVTYGAKERRQTVSSNDALTESDGQSLIGLVLDESSDLVGLQDAAETDAAQGVIQLRISAEWNGQGNLRSFAQRAHSKWRRKHGLVDLPDRSPRRVPARKRRRSEGVTVDEMDEYLFNGLALFLIFGYLYFHLSNDLPSFLDPATWEEMARRWRSY